MVHRDRARRPGHVRHGQRRLSGPGAGDRERPNPTVPGGGPALGTGGRASGQAERRKRPGLERKPAQAVRIPSRGRKRPLAADAGLAPSVHPSPPTEVGRRPFSCEQGGRPRPGHEWRAAFPFGGRGGRIRDTRSVAWSSRTSRLRLVAKAALSSWEACASLSDGPVWGFGADPAPTREGLRRRMAVGHPRGPVPPSTSDVARASGEVRSALRPGDRETRRPPVRRRGPSQVRCLVGCVRAAGVRSLAAWHGGGWTVAHSAHRVRAPGGQAPGAARNRFQVAGGPFPDSRPDDRGPACAGNSPMHGVL